MLPRGDWPCPNSCHGDGGDSRGRVSGDWSYPAQWEHGQHHLPMHFREDNAFGCSLYLTLTCFAIQLNRASLEHVFNATHAELNLPPMSSSTPWDMGIPSIDFSQKSAPATPLKALEGVASAHSLFFHLLSQPHVLQDGAHQAARVEAQSPFLGDTLSHGQQWLESDKVCSVCMVTVFKKNITWKKREKYFKLKGTIWNKTKTLILWRLSTNFNQLPKQQEDFTHNRLFSSQKFYHSRFSSVPLIQVVQLKPGHNKAASKTVLLIFMVITASNYIY